MTLSTLDLCIIFGLLAVYLLIGFYASKKSGKGSREFFLSGGKMPWWLLGISMVATTFSADTPNLVTDLVRKSGVSGNWAWWAFLLTGMLTVFVYARLWRRSGVLTDLEFYELRYAGKAASFLRGFRALYLGVVFNVLVMGTVSLAAIKIGAVILGLEAWVILAVAGTVTVLYSALGGLRAVILTDFIQFAIAMVGAIWAAATILHLPEVGGLDGLLNHENVRGKLNLLPDFKDTETLIPLLIIPLAVQWWSSWYPGSEPGGGGYVAQRMLSAKNENHSMGATFLFQVAHYALRPWPWIIVALASLIVFPDLSALAAAFPGVDKSIIEDDLAYSAMLTFLPSGLIGLVIASIASAYMSTISSHLNWGSSYIVHDFYVRFVRPEATEREQVMVGRLSTVLLMVLASFFALFLESAKDAFDILLQIGAGTGAIFILRWFWWRINAYTEITGMVVSFLVACYFQFAYGGDLANHWKMLIGVGITTTAWLGVTYLTRPEPLQTLRSFYALVGPARIGWSPIFKGEGENIPQPVHGHLGLKILALFTSTLAIYGALFMTGYLLYGNMQAAAVAGTILLICGTSTAVLWQKLRRFT